MRKYFTFLFTSVLITPIGARADECAVGYDALIGMSAVSLVFTAGGTCHDGYIPYTDELSISYPLADDHAARCPSGEHYVNGTCTAYATGNCDAGYFDAANNTGAMFVYTMAGACTPGYDMMNTTNVAMHLFDPVATSLRCGGGAYYNMNTNACVQFTTGNCEVGYVNATSMVTATSFNESLAGGCTPGLDMVGATHDAQYVIFSGATKCAPGTYPTGSGCAAHATTGCPTDYYAITPSTAFARIADDAECATNYSLFAGFDDDGTDLCRTYLGTSNMAPVCTPQLACTYARTVNSNSPAMSLPIHGEQATHPTLKFVFDTGDECYMNMLPGESSVTTINITDDNGDTYHGVI